MKRYNKTNSVRTKRSGCLSAVKTALLIWLPASACAGDYFNPALLEIGAPGQVPSNLSAFENTGGQLPGNYHVDIYLNNSLMDTRDVEFRMMPDATGKTRLLPCLTVDELTQWGVLTQNYPDLGATETSCANLTTIPQANSEFRFSRLQLLLSIPQSAVSNRARGWVDPKKWDDGIPALILNLTRPE